MQPTKPLTIREQTYKKLLALKSGELTSFTKVIDHLINENEKLRKQNIKLIEEKMARMKV